jgi:hypothetical protein
VVYQRAKGEPDKRPFGTKLDGRQGLRVDQPLAADHQIDRTTSASGSAPRRAGGGRRPAPSPTTPACSTSRR